MDILDSRGLGPAVDVFARFTKEMDGRPKGTAVR
jgi:hypothetical protein